MNRAKQVFVEIIRRPFRNFFLFAVIFILVLCCVADCFLRAVSENFYRIFAGVTGYGIAVEIDEYMELDMWEDTIQAILQNPHIVSYNNQIEIEAECEPVDFVNVSYDGSVLPDSGVWMYGYISIPYSSLFRNGKLSLIEGDYPTAEFSGVVIDQNLAAENDLQIGDVLTVCYEETHCTFTVRGIYEANEIPQIESKSEDGYYTDSSESILFCDYISMTKLTQTENSSILIFYLDDYQNMDECLTYVGAIIEELSTPAVVLDVINQNTTQMSEVFVMLNQMNDIVLGIIFLLCIVIVSIMVTLWFRTHSQMLTIYRVLGQDRRQTGAIILSEIIVVTMPTLLTAAMIGVWFVKQNAKGLFQNLLDWCEINSAEQAFAMENWSSGSFELDIGRLLLQIGILEGFVLLVTVLLFVHDSSRKQ